MILRLLLRLHGAFREIAIDRSRKRGGKLFLRRRLHQIDLGDEDASSHEMLRRPAYERRLAVAARRDQRDVLPVPEIRLEGAELALPVREGLVEGEIAVVERVRDAGGHALIIPWCV